MNYFFNYLRICLLISFLLTSFFDIEKIFFRRSYFHSKDKWKILNLSIVFRIFFNVNLLKNISLIFLQNIFFLMQVFSAILKTKTTIPKKNYIEIQCYISKVYLHIYLMHMYNFIYLYLCYFIYFYSIQTRHQSKSKTYLCNIVIFVD